MYKLMATISRMEHIKYLQIEPAGRKKIRLIAHLDPITLVSNIQEVAKTHGFDVRAGEGVDRILSLTHPEYAGVQIIYAGMKPSREVEKSVFEIETPVRLSASTRTKIVDFLNALKEKKRGRHLHLVK